MINQNIFIINFRSLYEVLYEIKHDLLFDIKNYDNEDSLLKNQNLNLKNSLIISKSYKNLLFIKDLSKANFFDLNLLPMSLTKLIELINIQLIKLKFNNQSKINIRDYELNLNSKFISKSDLNLKLTEKEIGIILYLNESNNDHQVQDLKKKIWGYSADMETHTVETHIYRLRKKIADKFNDENFILSGQNGYFIK